MAIHNLPKFSKRPPFPDPVKSQNWLENRASLRRLGKSLMVDDDPFGDPDEPIRAIPDPWAQARTFAEAVLDKEHSMHASFRGQWRGLLALIGLRGLSRADYSIDLHHMRLDSDHPLDRVLRRLQPQVALADDIGLWVRPVIVKVKPQGGRGVTLAMLNPACLISPGRAVATATVANVPWIQRGIVDPLELKGDAALPLAHLVVLKAYLENLRTALGDLPASDPGDALRQRLQEYIDDVARELGNTSLAARTSPAFNPDLPPVYQALWSSVDLQEVQNKASTSQCLLVLRGKAAIGALKGVILVDESLRNRAAGGGRDILVWGRRTLSELLASRPKLDEVRREAAEQGYLIATADDLFTKRAVRLRNSPRIAGHPAALKDMLLPLRPLSLLLDGALPSLVEGDADDQRASISLRVKLQGETGPVPHTLIRHFRDQADPGQPSYATDASWAFFNATVWPDFRATTWSSYFARFYYPVESDQIRPTRALSRGILEAALNQAPDPYQAVATLQAINGGQKPGEAGERWFRVSQVQSEVEHDEVQTSDCGFEAIFYTDHDADRGDAEAGCVWLDIKTIETTPRSNPVAVDFGTTNTVACFSDKKPIQFQQRLVNPISFDDSQKVQRQRDLFKWQFADFLPPDRRDLPTPTVAIARKGSHAAAVIPVFRNVVYFSPAATIGTNDAKMELDKYRLFFGRAMFNLKWSDDQVHVLAAADFLSQIMMMIGAEATARNMDSRRLAWRFSLPDSMPTRTRRNFQQHLSTLTTEISPEGSLDGLYSEGMSAAKYMLAGSSGAKLIPGTINMVLDIGGGTTDVTIWSDDVLLWRGSFRLAGQAFFTQTIVRNPDILRTIGLTSWANLLDPPESAIYESHMEGISSEDVPHLAELLFSGPALGKALDENWALKLNLKAGETLRVASLLFLGGIAYYLGIIARRLVIDGVITEDQLADPTFALCGRGAGLFARIHGSLPPNGRSDTTGALRMFSHAADVAAMPTPRLFIEPESKLEVVRGMVTDYQNIDALLDARREPRSSYLPTGLDLTFASGQALSSLETADGPIDGGKVASVALDPIDAFLRMFAEELEIEIDLRPADSEGAHALIRNEVRARIDRTRNEQGRTVIEEPPFVTALRLLVGEIAIGPSDPGRRLSVGVAA